MEKKKRMKKRWRIIIVVVVFLFIAANLAALGWFMGRGPFGLLHTYRYTRLEGNADIYRPETVELLESSPLAGKEIIFLGSSVTEGSAALGNSMAAYLGNRFCSEVVVEAVSGTTLVDTGNDSYVQRLERNLDTDLQPSLFVCQLSTNDATKGKPLGTIGDGFAREDFDTATIAGAMEYIISYAQETWDCPVMFYTGSRYDSATYEEMVALLTALQEKWGIGVIDLWNDDAFNTITRELSSHPARPCQSIPRGSWKKQKPKLSGRGTTIMGDSVMEDMKRRLFSKYLADAVPIAWETEEFEAVRQAFVEKNYSPHTSIPQEILISPVAYLSANPLFDDDKKHAETGHSKELLSELFLIQHLEYSEKVIKHTRKCYIADMIYYCQRNRDILRHLETRNDWYAREMVRWARAVKPLPVPTRKRTIVKYTRGWPGQLIFTRVNGGFWGSHEPYEEDRSRYSDLDIFGGEE